jgi:hypothetical protein
VSAMTAEWAATQVRRGAKRRRWAVTRALLGILLAFSTIAVPVVEATIAKASSLQMSSDSSVTGWYPNEPLLSPTNVTNGSFGEIFDTQLIGKLYAQPLIDQSTVLAVTENNYAYGLNSTTGAIEWVDSYGTPDDPLSNIGCGDVGNDLGITGTPVIDSATDVAYFVSAQEVSGHHNSYFMQAVNVLTGLAPTGWPSAGVPIVGHADGSSGTVFNPDWETQRPGLVLVNGTIYATFGSQCDYGTWQGWVIGVSESTHTITTMWASEENDTGYQGAGIWQSGSAPVVDSNGDIFVSTGNGDLPASAELGSDVSNQNYGEAVVELHTNGVGQLAPVNFFIPADAVSLNSQDGDLGSGGPVALPASMGTTGDPTPMVVDGKSGILYVLNMNHLGGYEQGSGDSDAVESEDTPAGGVWGKATVWPGDGGYVYLATAGSSPFNAGTGSLEAFQRSDSSNGTLTLPLVAATSNSGNGFSYGSGSPIVTSDGTTSGSALVWIIHASTQTGYDSQLEAFNPVPINPGTHGTLEQIWSSPPFTSTVFSQPSANNGIVYVGTKDDTLLGFGALPTSIPAIAGSDLVFPPTIVAQSTAPINETFTASAPTTVSSFTVSGAGYAIGTPSTALPALLQTGQTVTVPVTFTPQAFGANPGSLTANISGATASVNLSGQGDTTNASLSFSPDEVTFPPQLIGAAPVSTPVMITNISSSAITVTGFNGPAAPFDVNDYPATPLTLNPSGQAGDSFTFSAYFDPPGSSGDFDHDFNALATIDSSVGNFGVALSGSADPPAQIITDPSSLSFGQVAVGTSATMSFELGDQGGFPLDIVSSTPSNPASGFSALTNPFTQLAPAPYQISPNTSVEETVQFSPTSNGLFTASWLLEGNDGNGVQAVTFTGTGYTPLGGGGGGGGGGGAPAATTTTSTTTSTTTTTTTTTTLKPTLTITTRTARRGFPVTLRTSGDSGGGIVTFHVRNGTAVGCSVHGAVLRAKSVGTCIVIATRAGRGATPSVSSRPTVVNFARQAHLN